jgi:hypothetical protein
MAAMHPDQLVSRSAWHGVHCSKLPPDRRGWLQNGNRTGDFLLAPRCGARTRCGGECRQPAMYNGRCRLHGGLSTGPRTAEGLTRSRRARWKHGARSAQVRALLREARLQSRRTRALRSRLSGASAGHGVHRLDSASTSRAPRERVNRRDAETQRCRAGGTGRTSTATSNPLREQSSRHHSLPRGVARPNVTNSASRRLCVSAVDLPSSAGHGVHRLNPQPSTIGVHPRSSAAKPSSPAWHGVLRSFRDRLRASASFSAIVPVLRSPARTNG